jgi:hypothetical protein
MEAENFFRKLKFFQEAEFFLEAENFFRKLKFFSEAEIFLGS